MAVPLIGGLPVDDIRHLQGSFDLGWNGTGVVQSSIHFEDGDVIVQESMPGVFVDQIIDSVAALREANTRRRPGGILKGRIPITTWYAWRREWERGPKQHGVLWRAFFTGKFMDHDHSKFRAGNL